MIDFTIYNKTSEFSRICRVNYKNEKTIVFWNCGFCKRWYDGKTTSAYNLVINMTQHSYLFDQQGVRKNGRYLIGDLSTIFYVKLYNENKSRVEK